MWEIKSGGEYTVPNTLKTMIIKTNESVVLNGCHNKIEIVLEENCQTLVLNHFDIALIKGSFCGKILDDLISYDVPTIHVSDDIEITHYISIDDVAIGNQNSIKHHHYLNSEDYYFPPKDESSIHVDGYVFLIKETGELYCPHLYYKKSYIDHIKGMLLSYAI